MRNRTYLILLLVLIKVSHAGEVYKCTIDGEVTYSQMPCDENEQQQRMYKLEAIPSIVEQKNRQANEGYSSDKLNNDNTQSMIKTHILNNKIKRAYVEIDKYQRNMRSEIEAIKRKTYYAANNNAGANYLNALSNEMTAVSEKYKVYIDLEKDRISSYRSEIAALQGN